jgi:hypothetical protein
MDCWSTKIGIMEEWSLKNWSVGMMEYWSNGVRDPDPKPNTPSFHYSNIPGLYFSLTSAVSDTVERTSTVPGSIGVGACAASDSALAR